MANEKANKEPVMKKCGYCESVNKVGNSTYMI